MNTVRKNLNHSTDTHMAKKYNDILYDCMMRCNLASFANTSMPHYDTLLTYFSAVQVFYDNSFMLFESIIMDKETNEPLSLVLMKIVNSIELDFDKIESDLRYRNKIFFKKVSRKCTIVQRMINYGLQQRNMLVRESASEPKGKSTINYWKNKKSFAKGDLPKEMIR